MCGIVGILNQSGQAVDQALLQKMTQAINHRGPDGQGIFVDNALGLGHCRLAIIDLSAAANQPMLTADQRFAMVYNGEIYNFLQLRSELEKLGKVFHSHSDSEVVLQAFALWGEKAFLRFNGMFALAIWDRQQQTLILARDRYGIKPLYWYYCNQQLIFASEIKAILQHPSVTPAICYPALNEYFTFQNIFSDLTLFQDIKLLPAATILKLSFTQTTPTLTNYWDYTFRPDATLTATDCSERLYPLFKQAVKRQLVADTKVGSYLSGGIDSGAITAVATQHINRLSTFTCGFDLSAAAGIELNFDERASAEMIARAFKTEHYEMILHAGDMEYIMPKLIWHLEDLRVGQCYPNYYIAGLASKFVKVTLSGAGGDELFAGYPWRYYYKKPSKNFTAYFKNYYHYWQRLIADKQKINFFNAPTYKKIKEISTFEIFSKVLNQYQYFDDHYDFINASLYFELKTFLNGLFIVEDKLSMAHGLETRLPFLDNDLVDFALQIPTNLKLNTLHQSSGFNENVPYKLPSKNFPVAGKIILRKTMENILPAAIIAGKKQGFSAPDASWFRGKSIDYINQLLRDPKALLYEYISPRFISQILDEHSSGKKNHRLLIWSLLSFEWWCKVFLCNKGNYN